MGFLVAQRIRKKYLGQMFLQCFFAMCQAKIEMSGFYLWHTFLENRDECDKMPLEKNRGEM
jgi:hypothetical protein